jgi:hypothetical protein
LVLGKPLTNGKFSNQKISLGKATIPFKERDAGCLGC